MIIGVPKEIKEDERRVAVTPAGASELTRHGHTVLIEPDAGAGSGLPDELYTAAGARITPRDELFRTAELIVKVKEPQPSEYGLFSEGQTLFTYLHLAADRELTLALADRGVTAIAYETVQNERGGLPLLQPMSEVAGRMAPQLGSRHLEAGQGGRGVLLSGVPGVPPADVVIIGGGTVGLGAARIALGMGARVTVIEKSPERLRMIDDMYGGRILTLASNAHNIERSVAYADLLIGAVLIPGARAPRLVTEAMVRKMKAGSVIIDVAVDQGGCIETIDRVTTHSNPTYRVHDVVHYAVANIPGNVPRTATMALSNATLPYVAQIADFGILKALTRDPALAKGLNVIGGKVVSRPVAEAHGLACTPIESALKAASRGN